MNVLEYVIGAEEAAKITGYSPGTIKNMCAKGKISSKKIGNVWVIDLEKLKEELLVKKVLWKEIDTWVSADTPWVYDNTGLSLLINAEEIRKVILLGDYSMSIHNVNIDIDLEELEEKLSAYEKENEDFDRDYPGDLEEFFRSIGFENAEVFDTSLYGVYEDLLIYDKHSKQFYNQREGFEVEIYEWWDGSNWRTIEKDETTEETILILSKNEVSLDEWDGSNWWTGARFHHQYVRRIVEKDGEMVNGLYLIEYHSQYQDAHPTGRIVTLDELKNHLQRLNRDVEKYLEEIQEL